MDIAPVTIELYSTEAGRQPFEEWLESLVLNARVRVENRLHRLRLGLIGDSKYLGESLFELRIHTGPGYRIYYGMQGRTIVILLHGGDKSSQFRDIEAARKNWRDYLRRRL